MTEDPLGELVRTGQAPRVLPELLPSKPVAENSGSGYENSCRKCLLSLEHFVSSRKKTTTKKAECRVFFLSGNTCVSQTGGGTGISYPCPGSGGTTSRCACAQSLRSQPGNPAVPWSSLVEGGNLENGMARGICPATVCLCWGTTTCWSFPMLQGSGCVRDAARRCQGCFWRAP